MGGFNGAVLAYGQTGTGKTHTLLNLGNGSRAWQSPLAVSSNAL